MNLTAASALIFRITHIANVSWVLDHDLCCSTGPCLDPRFRSIGNLDLIEKRRGRGVPIPPGGKLSDYIPFYFTPWSPMLFKILTGHGGIQRQSKEDLVFIVASLRKLDERGCAFVLSDRHANLQAAKFANDLSGLDLIDWDLLNRRDFRNDPNDPTKLERYQAEALVHKELSVRDLLGFACYSAAQERELSAELSRRDLPLTIGVREGWYFE
jgi:hypothetical protein